MRGAAACPLWLLAAGAGTVLFGPQASAQLQGRVVSVEDRAPIAGATVTVEGTALFARSDSLGRWIISDVPPGPATLLTRRIGFAPARTPIVVPLGGALSVEVVLATNPLRLDQLIVTADRAGRARGELGTASVIDRDAIANQIAASLQGVLELLPGVALQPPGLDAAAQFSLRAMSQTSPDAAAIGAAGTLIILDGVPLSNNANLQTVGVRGDVVPPASTAGGGIDLRRIPAATLERVEVIRGIPSARWGDLTQGAIIVDTRAAETAPEFSARFDPRTAEGSIVGGRAWRDERQALTATLNIAETRQARTLSSASTLRGAGQAAHRIRLGAGAFGNADRDRLTLDTRLHWWRLRFDNPERVDVEPGRNSFQDDWGLRLAERARLALATSTIELTLSYDIQRQYTRESRILGSPTAPFTDRLEEGRHIGTYVEGLYDAEYELRGAPRLLYSRLEWEWPAARPLAGLEISHVRAGAEVRREWNAGAGYAFDIARPPQTSNFTGVNGYDRPRRFDVIPPLVTSALYADTRLTLRRGGVVAEAQPGVRLDVLHDGAWWLSSARSAVIQPRFAAQVAPRPWIRLRGGVGAVGKVPTIAQLYPARQYFDVVNVNRFTPDPSERLAVLTTFIRDPRNPDLRLSRGFKQEIGFELDGGARRGALSVTWFDDRIRGAVTRRRDALVLMRDRYELADTAAGSGQPGRIVDPPIGADPIAVFLDRSANGGNLGTRGAEFTLSAPIIPAIRTRLEVSGATVETRFTSSDRDFGSIVQIGNFQTDSAPRLAWFEGSSNVARQTIVTWRVIQHHPDLGFVVTGTVQQRRGFERRVTGRTDSLSFGGYVTRTGEIVTVAEEDKLLPEYADLRQARPGTLRSSARAPDDWVFSLQLAKTVGANGRLSFYAFNALDKLVTFGGGGARGLPAARYGVELMVPMSDFPGFRR